MPNESGWVYALERTRRAAFGRVASLLGASELTPAAWEEIENSLLQADLGPALSAQLVRGLQETARGKGMLTREAAMDELRSLLSALLPATGEPALVESPCVILIVGVNGSGKTTSVAKLGQLYAARGKRVLLAAADTFRAAASL